HGDDIISSSRLIENEFGRKKTFSIGMCNEPSAFRRLVSEFKIDRTSFIVEKLFLDSLTSTVLLSNEESHSSKLYMFTFSSRVNHFNETIRGWSGIFILFVESFCIICDDILNFLLSVLHFYFSGLLGIEKFDGGRHH